MCDVLALPVATAMAVLRGQGYQVEVRREAAFAKYPQEQTTALCEFVVRQQLLDTNIMVLTTVVKPQRIPI